MPVALKSSLSGRRQQHAQLEGHDVQLSPLLLQAAPSCAAQVVGR